MVFLAAEILKVANKELILTAKIVVVSLGRISKALEHVDSTSGTIGSVVDNTIEILASIISKPEVPDMKRHEWLEKLWKVLQADNSLILNFLEIVIGIM